MFAHSLLAMNMDMMAKAVLLVLAVVLLLAFFVGFKKGVKQVGWKGLACFASFELYYLLNKVLKESGFADKLPKNEYLDGGALFTVLLAVVCALLALVLYGTCSKLFRPSYRWVTKKRLDLKSLFLNDFEKRDENYDREGVQRQLVWRNAGFPNFFGRMLGAFICMINVAAMLLFLLAVAMLVINNSPLQDNGIIVELLKDKKLTFLHTYATSVGLDYVFICILINIACIGYKKGLFASILTFFTSLGGLASLVLGFYLPYSKLGQAGGLKTAIDAINKMLMGISAVSSMGEKVAPIVYAVSQTIVGCILCIIFVVILFFLKELLKSLVRGISRSNSARTIDGMIAALLYFLIGVIICVVVCIVLRLLVHFGVIDFTLPESGFAKHLYELGEKLIKPLLESLTKKA